ncbi:hypothetical protein HMH01_07300 [Halovulum dunhuangense]|uniref:Sulfotransferase family protein n=1 Tax=Halovulum dunhuangense TaxID=1505036 RepID=A0A849L1U9_9RHOB|nr:sulfotransferase [Halovulum dunhuangense]NNU80243.1 hypothetical protein [Halovulum dunhuangense]
MSAMIAFLGTKRTGSSQVMQAMAAHSRVMAYGEIFNPKPVLTSERQEGLTAFLRERLGPGGGDTRPLSDLRRSDPAATLSAIRAFTEARGRQVTVFKCFEGQMDTVPLVDALAAQGARCVFLLRRPIDCYISLMKARQADSWGGVDTTSMKVRLGARHYAAWHRKVRGYHEDLRDALVARGLDWCTMRYEDAFAGDDPSAALTALAARWGIDLGTAEVAAQGIRQDRARSPARKVENWASFRLGLLLRGKGGLVSRDFLA